MFTLIDAPVYQDRFIDMSSWNGDPTKAKVLIVGAGIAGLTLGILLHKANIPFEIFERCYEIRPIGMNCLLFTHLSALIKSRSNKKKLCQKKLLYHRVGRCDGSRPGQSLPSAWILRRVPQDRQACRQDDHVQREFEATVGDGLLRNAAPVRVVFFYFILFYFPILGDKNTYKKPFLTCYSLATTSLVEEPSSTLFPAQSCFSCSGASSPLIVSILGSKSLRTTRTKKTW